MSLKNKSFKEKKVIKTKFLISAIIGDPQADIWVIDANDPTLYTENGWLFNNKKIDCGRPW